jgi:hypothetical protein
LEKIGKEGYATPALLKSFQICWGKEDPTDWKRLGKKATRPLLLKNLSKSAGKKRGNV